MLQTPISETAADFNIFDDTGKRIGTILRGEVL
jgi:hypothetical protein